MEGIRYQSQLNDYLKKAISNEMLLSCKSNFEDQLKQELGTNRYLEEDMLESKTPKQIFQKEAKPWLLDSDYQHSIVQEPIM